MKAQIYTKTDGKDTSVVVSNDKGNIYFQNVFDSSELTVIQRGVSFVKHQLDSDVTEIYPDKVSELDIMNDEYIIHSNIGAVIGANPNEKAQNQCVMNLQIHQRWDLKFIKERKGNDIL